MSERLLRKSLFLITKMDCPSEENMIRVKLDGMTQIKQLDFDLEKRELTVIHIGEVFPIEKKIVELNLNSTLMTTQQTEDLPVQDSAVLESKVLLINFGLCLIEMVSGLFSESMGLVADSLDMLADAFVYGLSLFAVGAAIGRKKRIATMSGYLQLVLAFIGMAEVIRRFVGIETSPDFRTMIIVSMLALVANAVCLYLLKKSKSNEAHMRASMIFTSNDVIINLGVIVAGALTYFTQSNKPDLIIGSIVFVIVTKGAFRILQLGK
jgi:Co/Zn/Cd efflux system component